MRPGVPAEQELYARWLARGSRVGLGLLIAFFLVYVLGLLEPHTPLAELPALWSHPVEQYRSLTGHPVGWEWLQHLGKGDYLNLLAITVLALVSAVCYARIVPALWAQGDRLRAGLAVAQVLVLLAAASGLLAGGH
jgi:hypothetical protein